MSGPKKVRVIEGSAGADGRDHLDARECWCDPEILQPCPECDDDEPDGCWRCGGRGLVDEHDPFSPVVVGHRYPEAGP